ncbi:MAG: acyl-ACP--UDP-N-acetylglucosamine O-acyltransferase [Alphaproteobacteria bacterium]
MATIHATALVEDGARLSDDVEIGPYCIVGGHVELAAGVRLVSHVHLEGHTSVGEGTVIHPFASLGSWPQHLRHQGEPTTLIIGARNIVREHVTMNVGTAMGRGETRVGEDNMFMAGSHVAHDCIVGNHVIFANNATLGGHVQVADHVFLGGLCAVHQNARIGRFAFVGGMAGLEGDLIPFGSVTGNRAHLAGLNLVGMKRRDLPRERIHTIRRAYRALFNQDGSFADRVAQVEADFKDSEDVMEIIGFVRDAHKRPLCLPWSGDAA